jgi:hypothetical protein
VRDSSVVDSSWCCALAAPEIRHGGTTRQGGAQQPSCNMTPVERHHFGSLSNESIDPAAEQQLFRRNHRL